MKIVALVRKFVSDEQGMETVEWAVLAALIVAGLATLIGTLGTQVKARFQTLVDNT